MSEEYEPATPEQKLNIAKFFIMSSPTGEVHDVVKDVITLVNDAQVLSEDELNSIMREYNLNTLVSAAAPDGSNVIVSRYGEVASDLYLDPITGKALKFDHRKQVFVGESDQRQVLSEGISAQRAAVHRAMRQYMESAYNEGRWALAVYGADDAQITVCISAKNAKLSSFWTGGIQSQYTFNASNPGPVDLSGNVKINVHYFEDGNVQLHINHNKSARVQIGDPEATGKSVAAAIGKLESDFHSSLEEVYLNMNSDVFKSMRRILPVTREPMTWNSAAHSLASNLNK